MSENEIDEVEEFGIENYSGQLWTRDTWLQWVVDELNGVYEEDFCKHIAEMILIECDWQCLSTLLEEYDIYGTIDDEYEAWLKNKKD